MIDVILSRLGPVQATIFGSQRLVLHNRASRFIETLGKGSRPAKFDAIQYRELI
jgi:hypothetical protein